MATVLQVVLQVVLDTNVIIAALRSQQGASFRLLSRIGDPRWQMNLSPALVFEYEEVARREATALWADPQKVEDILDYLCANSNQPRIAYSWRPCLRDPDDDMILELAVAARADFIVTHNQGDFQGANQFGVSIVTPREFLKTLQQIQ